MVLGAGGRVIEKCALAVITKRGRNVVSPTMSRLDEQEEDFLLRHIQRLRDKTNADDTRGRMRDNSTLLEDFAMAIEASGEEFLTIAERLVRQLAEAMQRVNSTASCVVAFAVAVGPPPGAERTVSL